MSVVAFPSQPDPAPVDRFLDSLTAATTRAGYAETLKRLLPVTGTQFPAAALQPEHYAAAMERWTAATAATWNRHLSALTSFTTWAQRQEILATNPGPAAGAPQERPPRRPLHPAHPAGDAVH
ncbi:hypothetical protein ACIBI9_66335 [Nonomuraea sp. NPDC050451]|uniref:hypothetical protein n=1 Tax=Nonomuraea sp. NPDC050451 TaxID=3364364 RepID=UPI00379A2E75